MLVQHLIENIFRTGLTIVSFNNKESFKNLIWRQEITPVQDLSVQLIWCDPLEG